MIYQVQLQCPSMLMVEANDPQDAVNKFWDALSKSGAIVFSPVAGSGDSGPKLMEMLKNGLEPKPEPKSALIIPTMIPPQIKNGKS